MNKEQEKSQEDMLDELKEYFVDEMLLQYIDFDYEDIKQVKRLKDDDHFKQISKRYYESLRNWILANFIAKRDLRKLLEGERMLEKTDIDGVVFASIKYRNQVIDDILAEIEKP